MTQSNNKISRPSMIQALSDAELELVSAGGENDGETLAAVAAGFAGIGAATAAVPPVSAAFLAVAATTFLVAIVAEAVEG